MTTAKQANTDSNAIAAVDIDLGERSYKIHIGENISGRNVVDYLPFSMQGRSAFVLTDENVSNPHAMALFAGVKAAGARDAQLLAMPAGEKTKSYEFLERTHAWLLDHKMDRGSILFAVGGGVIGDLGGFAAATAMRGIDFVQVPTTLLAQVDSSVGGKTGINTPQGKNLVGAFYQPKTVIADIGTLQTFPRRELLAGYAEVVKYGLINDEEFFIWLEKSHEDVLSLKRDAVAKAVETSCRKKAEIVAADEREQGQRALLNLGHTFGHALEAAAQYDGRLLHGEAVAIGMVMAFKLSARMGLCDEADAARVETHLKTVGLPVSANMIFPPIETSAETLWDLMQGDKKAVGGKLKFILCRGIGKSFITGDVKKEDVISILEESLNG